MEGMTRGKLIVSEFSRSLANVVTVSSTHVHCWDTLTTQVCSQKGRTFQNCIGDPVDKYRAVGENQEEKRRQRSDRID